MVWLNNNSAEQVCGRERRLNSVALASYPMVQTRYERFQILSMPLFKSIAFDYSILREAWVWIITSERLLLRCAPTQEWLSPPVPDRRLCRKYALPFLHKSRELFLPTQRIFY